MIYDYAFVKKPKVYLIDNWSGYSGAIKAYKPIELSIDTFKSYEQGANGTINSLVYYTKN